MKSISFNQESLDLSLCFELVEVFKRNKAFFNRISRGNNDLLWNVFHHALHHYEPQKGALEGFCCALIKKMMKSKNRDIAVDFLESTLSEELDRNILKNQGREDLTDKILTKLDTTDSKVESIVKLALQGMLFFNLMCEHLLAGDSEQQYFPEWFRKSAVKLGERCGFEFFSNTCKDIYRVYGTRFADFMYTTKDESRSWKELDKNTIDKSVSKRIFLAKAGTSDRCENPDSEDWVLEGNLNGKRIVRVNYKGLYDEVIDLLDEDISPLKFTIGDTYICRTLGGSLSCVNTSLFNEYEKFRLELATNLLSDLNARYLAMGDTNIYLLIPASNSSEEFTLPKRIIRGVKVDLTVEDITSVALAKTN